MFHLTPDNYLSSRRTKNSLGCLILLLSLGLGISACGDDNGRESPSASCVDAANPDAFCRTALNDDMATCDVGSNTCTAPDPALEGCADEPVPDAFCQTATSDPTARCNLAEDQCEIPAPPSEDCTEQSDSTAYCQMELNDADAICEPVQGECIIPDSAVDNCTQAADPDAYCVQELGDEDAFCNAMIEMCEDPNPGRDGCIGPAADVYCQNELNDDGATCDTTLNECVPSAPVNCNDAPMPDMACQEQFGSSNAMCDPQSGVCVGTIPSGDTYTAILISDFSTAPASCEASMMTLADGDTVSDAGSDILYLTLKDDLGNAVGWGRALDLQLGSGDVDLVTTAHLDGTAPLFIDPITSCPANLENRPNSDQVVSLGCGGALAVQFIDAGGNPIAIEDGYTIEVGEYGSYCISGDPEDVGTDRFAVFACTDSGAVGMGDTASCDRLIASELAGNAQIKVTVN